MKFQIFSDLHQEHFNSYTEKYGKIQVRPDVSVVFLLGDISFGLNSFKYAAKLYQEFGVPVVWIPGNHEFYGYEINDLLNKYQKINYEGVIKLLGLPSDNINDNMCIINGVRICGGTLWTNYKLYEGSNRLPTQYDAAVSCRINDYNRIRNKDVLFTALDSIKLHEINYNVIKSILDIPYEGKTLVASHHGPHSGSVHPRYSPSIYSLDSKIELPGENRSFILNPGFCSYLPELLEKADVWIHGHVHDSMDYMVGNTRVITNPRGYPIFDEYEFRYENRAYKSFDYFEI